MKRPRKDYGCPLRIYADADWSGTYTILPPRSGRSAARFRDGAGWWTGLYCVGSIREAIRIVAGDHLGKRITWAELPAAVQRFARQSILAEYCPTDSIGDSKK